MNKNIEDNDQRAAKQHKKEIAILQKNAEKELKLLTAEHSDRAKEFAPKKRVLIHKNLESVADISKKLIQFREEKLFEIESHKSNLNSDIEVLKLGTDLKIQEELNKYNEIERDNAIKLIGVSLKQELDLEQVLDTQSKLEIVFNKEKAYNKLKHDEALANKAKEFNVFGVNNEEGLKIAKLRKTIEITKLDNETELAEKELVLDIKVNEENEKIDYHNLDFIVQGQISNENLLYQTEFKSLFEAREDSLLAYEELEANNRALLKVKFLEAQKAKIEADKDAFIKKINTSSEAEKVLYEQEKEKVSSKDLEELKIYEEEANKNIENITIKRDTLDRKENKKEIKELDLEIKNLRDKLNSYVKTKNVSISLNTELFNKGIEEVNDRNALSIEQTEDFFGLEVSRIDKAINLVNQNKNEEINDAKEGHLKTFENTSLLLQNAQIRNNQSIEQNTAYKISMVQNKNDVIKDFKDDFEKQKHEINESFNKAISELESEIKSEESKISGDISKEESNLEHKVVAFDKKFQEIKNDELKELNKLASAHKENFSKIEQKENIEIKKIKDEFTQKESSCKSKISEINKKSGNHSKIFESNKKAAKRDYELALSKKISELNSKLQQDIKAL